MKTNTLFDRSFVINPPFGNAIIIAVPIQGHRALKPGKLDCLSRVKIGIRIRIKPKSDRNCFKYCF